MRSHQTIHYEFAKGPIAVGMGNGLHRIGHSRPRIELVTTATMCDIYRFGFNGKENDNEVKCAGVQQDYGMRIYDTRLGRFLSVDPIAKDYPFLTPYQSARNSPIQAIDLDGLEKWTVTGNTITMSATYVAYTNRKGGGSIPKDFDIKGESEYHWQSLNNQLKNVSYSLTITQDGSTFTVTPGDTKYNLVFEVKVIVVENEETQDKNPEYQNAQKDGTLAGRYLFGPVEINKKVENTDLATWYSDGGFRTQNNIIQFKDEQSFTADAEFHEDGHDFGLDHFSKLGGGLGYFDTVKTPLLEKNGSRYNSSGMMKNNKSRGSSVPLDTQLENMLEQNPGSISK